MFIMKLNWVYHFKYKTILFIKHQLIKESFKIKNKLYSFNGKKVVDHNQVIEIKVHLA